MCEQYMQYGTVRLRFRDNDSVLCHRDCKMFVKCWGVTLAKFPVVVL
jgi:hypothetical protein